MQNKINWTAVAAIVGIVTICVYALQAFYMYCTLRAMEGTMALQFYADYSKVSQKLIASSIYPYYRKLGNAVDPSEDYKLNSPEIYAYLDCLDVVSLLYLAGRFEERTLVDFYEEAILFAFKVLANASKAERNFYKGIIEVANQLMERKKRRTIIPTTSCVFPIQ